jgi:hypothetical protein
MEVKVVSINSVRKINSKKYPGKTFDVTQFTSQDGTVADTFDTIEVGKTYTGEMSTDSYGLHFKVVKLNSQDNRVVDLLTELIEINRAILAKTEGKPTKSREAVLAANEDEEPPRDENDDPELDIDLGF